MSVVVEVLDEESTISDSLLLRLIVYMKNITFDVLKVSENSSRIGSQPAIKDNQPCKNTKEQHGLFYT